jgi:transcriptional regulator with PAS, ATPase and Fis domain
MSDTRNPNDGDEGGRAARRVAEVPSTIPISPRTDPSVRRIVVIAGDRVSTHPLPESGQFTIGRAEDARLRIDDPSVSREHATLHFEKGKPIQVGDNGSSNGTRVRGKQLAPGQKVQIAAGEAFELGSVLCMVQAPFDSLSADADRPSSNGSIVIGDQTMAGIYQLAERVAKSTINVLLLGETGVGKDVLARRIHKTSQRSDKPYLPLNCGALSEQLLESELFGHERGSFTGAVETKQGLLEAASGGTVFLDEVGELPMAVQVKLLRVLEERQVRRVGGIKSRPFDIRFIAATNRDLTRAIDEGGFRADLFYRLNGISLLIPPLRQRRGEIEELAEKFVADAASRSEAAAPRISAEALGWLKAHDWPGNIRELQNTMERAVLLCQGPEITMDDLATATASPTPGGASAGAAPVAADENPERQRIIDALEKCAGNQTRAAKLLGISRNTLLARLDAYNIPRPRKPVR